MNPRITEIPVGWRKSWVGKEFSIQNQLREPISSTVRAKMKGPYPYYGPTKAVDSLDHFRVNGTYALIGEDGDHFFKYAEQDMTQLVSGKFNVNNHAHLVKGKGECTTEWFYEYFRQRALTPYLTRQGAGRYKLNKEALKELPILVPPRDEQLNIHKIIRDWDRSIGLTEQLIVAKQKLRKGLMQHLLSGKRRFPGFTKPWLEIRFSEVFTNRTETGRTDLPLVSITGSGGVIFRDELDRKDTSSANKSKYLRICPGDIGYNTMRMWQGVSGLSRIEGIVSPAYTIVTPDKSLDSEFMALLFKYPPVVYLFYRYSQGLVSDTWNLKFRHFSEIRVKLPEKKEQEAIAAVFQPIGKELDLLNLQLAAFKQQKKGLMQQLLTGKVRVKVDEDSAA